MKVAFVASTVDPASVMMLNYLKRNYDVMERENLILKTDFGEFPIYIINYELIYSDDFVNSLGEDFLIFLSRHESSSGIPTLSAHSTGNFGEAKFGGKPRTLAMWPAVFIKEFLIEVSKRNPGEYNVTLEPTHHGPTPNKLVAFVEVGSKEENWKDEDAAAAVVDSALVALEKFLKCDRNYLVLIGVGGPHYSPFTKYELESEIAIGHVIPKYNQEYINPETLRYMIKRTFPEADGIALLKKGVRGEYRKIVKEFCEENDVRLFIV